MRWAGIVAGALVITVLFHGMAVQPTAAADAQSETDEPKQSAKLAQLVRNVRANEALYENLETTIERTVGAAAGEKPDAPSKYFRKETRRTVRQNGLLRFEGEETRVCSSGDLVTEERLSSYDGNRTVSVEEGNSVNIDEGRYEPSQVTPPHCWTLAPWHVSFPLSVFLEGADAIRKHPKYRSHPVGSGTIYEFPRVECWLEGNEEVDGLNCVRVRCKRWYSSRPRTIPIVYALWIAPERNYLCVKAQAFVYDTDEVWKEAVVDEMEEISDGLWLPKRVVGRDFAGGRVYRRDVTEVVYVAVNPTYPASYFAESGESDDLPVYHIVNDRLKNSALDWKKAKSSDEHIARIVEAIRANEAKFARIETKLRETLRDLGDPLVSSMSGGGKFISTSFSDTVHRSVIDGNRAFVQEMQSKQSAENEASQSTAVFAFDGQWTRSFHTYGRPDRDPPAASRYAGLQQGESEYVSVWRPHSVALRSLDKFRPFSEILESSKFGSLNSEVEYLGTQNRDRLVCDIVCIVGTSTKSGKPYLKEVIWLARDRCYLPIRNESYTLRWSDQLPTAVTEVRGTREIAPGIYLPMHVVTNRFESYAKGGLSDDRLIVKWRKEWLVDSVTLAPTIDPSLFEVVTVPAGTDVSVSDSEGNHLGSFEQRASGNLFVAPEEFDAMRIHAEKERQDEEERLAAMNALLGQPAPVFPEAKWLNSEPLSWEQLKGKVVLLDFWAVWCGPCRRPLSQLAEIYGDLEEAGVVVIGVHTAGSEFDDVEKFAQDEKLGFPICVDVPPPDGRAWGSLFGKFVIHQIPYSYVIDKEGKVAAHGQLDQMLITAGVLPK